MTEEKQEEQKTPASAETTADKEEKIEEEKKEEKTEEKKEEKKEEQEEVEVPKKFRALVEEIEKMSVLELAELVKILEKKFGVSAVPLSGVAAVAPASAEATAGEEEKSIFNIELKEVGEKKIEVIKVVRDVMEKGLKEAKDLVDAVASGPQMIKENSKKEEAEEIKKKFEAAGAKVELK